MARILVVDDDKDLQENIVEILSDAGFEMHTADSAEQALDLVADASFDVILLDLVMPGISGMDALPLFKRKNPRARIIMITAFSTVENAVRSMKKGADDYITKPFKIDELLMSVRRNLEEARLNNCRGILEMDGTFSCLANAIRRQILVLIQQQGRMRFMDITRQLGIEDHTKVNFHLKVLKEASLIEQDARKLYLLAPAGDKAADCLKTLTDGLSP